MFVIRPTILPFFCNWWDRQPWVMELQSLFKPLKVIISSLNSFTKAWSFHNVCIIWMLKYSSLLFLIANYFYLYIFAQQFIRRDLNTVDDLGKILLLSFCIEFQILPWLFNLLLFPQWACWNARLWLFLLLWLWLLWLCLTLFTGRVQFSWLRLFGLLILVYKFLKAHKVPTIKIYLTAICIEHTLLEIFSIVSLINDFLN